MNNNLNLYFDGYLNIGLKPIILQYMSKKPLFKNWNKSYDPSIWKNTLIKNKEKQFNIAILLGDIVDVEGDTQEANEILNDIIGDYEHPCFKSSRSIHHLFLNPDPNMTVFKIENIEFRGNKVCSMVPPSVHEDGTKYKFLEKSKFPIPIMPAKLLEFYFKNKKEKNKNIYKSKSLKPKTKRFHTKTLCLKCNRRKFIHKKRLCLEVKAFSLNDLPWMCHDCRSLDVREICRMLNRNQI